MAKYLGIAAVGTAGGAAFVLLPGAPAPAGGKQPGVQQPPRLLEVGDRALLAHRDAVTALALGRHGGSQVRRKGSSALMLL